MTLPHFRTSQAAHKIEGTSDVDVGDMPHTVGYHGHCNEIPYGVGPLSGFEVNALFIERNAIRTDPIFSASVVKTSTLRFTWPQSSTNVHVGKR